MLVWSSKAHKVWAINVCPCFMTCCLRVAAVINASRLHSRADLAVEHLNASRSDSLGGERSSVRPSQNLLLLRLPRAYQHWSRFKAGNMDSSSKYIYSRQNGAYTLYLRGMTLNQGGSFIGGIRTHWVDDQENMHQRLHTPNLLGS